MVLTAKSKAGSGQKAANLEVGVVVKRNGEGFVFVADEDLGCWMPASGS